MRKPKPKLDNPLTTVSFRIGVNQKKAIKRHARILKQYESYVVRQALYLYFRNMGVTV